MVSGAATLFHRGDTNLNLKCLDVANSSSRQASGTSI
jgi:hypothetical protein